MNYSKISSIEAIAFVLIAIINNAMLNFPKYISDSTGSASLLNSIYVSILVFLFFVLVVNLFKNFKNDDIVDISEFLGGKVLKIIVGIMFIFIFLYMCALNVRVFSESLKITYFNEVPIVLILLCFLVVAVISNKFGSRPVMKTLLIMAPIVIISFLIIFLSVSPRFVIQRMFPVLGNGINETFLIGSSNLFAFSGLSYIFFLMPLLNKKEDFKKVTYISVIISSIAMILSVALLLFALSNVISIHEFSPLYVISKAANFGKFFQKLEALFVFIWILSLMAFLSIMIMIISNIFKKLTNVENEKNILSLIAGFILIFALFPKDITELRFWKYDVFKYVSLITLFLIPILILIFANMKYKKNKMKER